MATTETRGSLALAKRARKRDIVVLALPAVSAGTMAFTTLKLDLDPDVSGVPVAFVSACWSVYLWYSIVVQISNARRSALRKVHVHSWIAMGMLVPGVALILILVIGNAMAFCQAAPQDILSFAVFLSFVTYGGAVLPHLLLRQAERGRFLLAWVYFVAQPSPTRWTSPKRDGNR